MSDYVIGDVQGCFDALCRLLSLIEFDPAIDQLWFVGDLVNRGPQSLEVLRFIRELPKPAHVVLGNHDLYLLTRLFTRHPYVAPDDTLADILSAPDALSLGHWLRQKPVLYHDQRLGVVMTHAGMPPCWTLEEALAYAQELSAVLQGPQFADFLLVMYGDEPHEWSESLRGMPRWRLICNYFTRMRFCDAEGRLLFSHKGETNDVRDGMYPWYAVPNRRLIREEIVFGHWAALNGKTATTHVHALDTGCVWGRSLTALRLQDMQRFSVPG